MLKIAPLMFIYLDKTPECDGQTDRQTDGQTVILYLVHCIASNADAL